MFFRLGAALLRALPLEWASAISGRGWRWAAPFTRRHRRALAHIALAFPHLDEVQREKIARDMWENLGRVFAESFHLDEIAFGGRVRFAPGSEPEKILPADRRFVACAPHLGNWEAAAAGMAMAGARTAGVYQRIKNPLVDAYVRRMRAPFYPGGLHPKHTDAGRKVLAHIKAGGAFATMADLRDHMGVSVPFFGRLAPSTGFPAQAARATGVPLFAAMIARAPLNGQQVRFEITLREIPAPRSADRGADVAAATAALQAAFEDFVRAHPGQWMWAHRRWG